MASLEKREVIDLINHIREGEQHFNSLQKDYRLLASTWLLATFGAMGFLVQGDNELALGAVELSKLALIAIIGLVSNIGIWLLWLIDIKIYHKLLNAFFLQGVKLEMENDWVPKMRTDMLLGHEGGDVVDSTGLYYIISCTLLIAISVFSACYLAQGNTIAMVVLILSAIAWSTIQIRYMVRVGRNPRAEKMRRLVMGSGK